MVIAYGLTLAIITGLTQLTMLVILLELMVYLQTNLNNEHFNFWYRHMESNHNSEVRSLVYYPLYDGGIIWCRLPGSNRVPRFFRPLLWPHQLQRQIKKSSKLLFYTCVLQIELTICNVHSDLESKAHILRWWCSPSHVFLLNRMHTFTVYIINYTSFSLKTYRENHDSCLTKSCRI